MTKQDTISILAIIATFFPHGFSLADKAMVAIWHRELEAYEAADVEAAVRHLCRTKDAFPSLKDVIDRLGSPVASAPEAWAELTAWAAQAAKGPLFKNGEVIPAPELPAHLAAAAATLAGPDEALAVRIAGRSGVEDGVMRAHFFRAWEEHAAKKRDVEARAAIAPPAPARQRRESGHVADVLRQVLPPGGAA